ncbi:MAG: winged helix-turn-helix domain-containing protein [Bacteroidaceae bacterium]|nr:winged helix-turn-helix domain-containing protein [Bacteroidaceae bacterium]
MAEKKTTTKAAAEKKAAPAKKACATKKATTTTKKVATKVAVIDATAAGFKAGDVYEALAAAQKALTVKEIAKAAKISEEETLVGMGWLFKEGKIVAAEEKYTLA